MSEKSDAELRIEILDGIRAVKAAQDDLDNQMEELMHQATEAQATYRQIARARGVSYQAVYQWFDSRRARDSG